MLNENQTTNTEDNKAKIELLEESIKTAFSEVKYDDVRNIADQIKAIDSENHLALHMLEKVQKNEEATAKTEAKSKEKLEKAETKAKEKEAELREKAETKEIELKAKLEAKAETEKQANEMKAKKEEINGIETKLKESFKSGEFGIMDSLVDELKTLDPENTFGDKLLSKIEKAKEDMAKAELKAKEKEAEIKAKAEAKEVELKIKAEAKAVADKKAMEIKAKKDEEREIKLKAKVEAKAKIDELKVFVENKNWDEVQAKANEILKNVKKQSDAIKALKVVAKEKNIENYMTLITAYNAEEEMGFFEKLFYKKSGDNKINNNNLSEGEKLEDQNLKLEKSQNIETTAFIGPINKKPEVQVLKLEKEGDFSTPVEMTKDEVEMTKEKVEITKEKVEITKEKVEITSKQEKGNVFASIFSKKNNKTKATNKENKGNVFTSMFGKKDDDVSVNNSHSIIDTIVQKTDESVNDSDDDYEKFNDRSRFKSLSGAFLQLSLAFVIVTAGFFYIENIDKQNTVLGLFGVEDNYASQLHHSSEMLDQKKEEERTLNKDINKYKSGYNNQYEDIINNIIDQRLNWPDILEKINEVTESVFEHNSLSQYVVYNSFSFDAVKGIVRVSGTMTDPLGKNLTKLIELEEAFMYYPKDKNDPNDKREPYFYDIKEFNSLTKSFNKNEGKYTSNLQLSFSTKKTDNNK